MIAVWVRIGAVAMVVLVHIALLLIFTYRQRRDSAEGSSMQWVLVPVRTPAKIEEPHKPPIGRLPHKNSRATQQGSTEASRTPPSAPAIDWRSSAATAASEAVAKQLREERYRNFGLRKPAAVEPEPRSIFATPKHKAGDIEQNDTQGVARIFHSEHCFTQLMFPTLKEQPKPYESREKSKLNGPRCMFPLGKPEARGDLFDHLKKERPWPDIKPGTETGPLPERVEPQQQQ